MVTSLKEKNSCKIYMNTLGVNIELVMPNTTYEAFVKNHSTILPNLSQKKLKNIDSSSEIKIVADFGKPSIKIEDNTVIISSRADANQFSMDVSIITSKLLERELNRQGMYSLHASAIYHKGKGVVFIGQPGSGKSTTALSCCLLKDQIYPITDNRVILNNNFEIVGGTTSFSIRNGSLISEFSKLVPLSRKLTSKVNDKWDLKSTLRPKDLGLCMHNKFPVKVDEIFLVKKLPKELAVGKKVDVQGLLMLRLYEAISFYSDTMAIFLGGRLPYPEIFNYKAKIDRTDFVVRLLDKLQVSYIEGELEKMSSYVLNKLNS